MSNTTVHEKRARIMSQNNCLSLELTATTNQKATFPSPGPKSLLLSLSLFIMWTFIQLLNYTELTPNCLSLKLYLLYIFHSVHLKFSIFPFHKYLFIKCSDTHMDIHMHIDTHIHTHTQTYIQRHRDTHRHTYRDTHIHTHTQTHTDIQRHRHTYRDAHRHT